MKFKALRTKKEPKEFVELTNLNGTWMVFTSELPHPLSNVATIDKMKELFEITCPLPDEINLDDYELVEFEMFEANTVGADIRNKLTPSLNLVSMLKRYFGDWSEDLKKEFLPYIKKEMEKSEENIKYISNLL